jgi:CheY-like chemotaxis protein
MSQGTVLIVDDSPLIRQMVADAFVPQGYDVLVASDGAEALRKIADGRPDLIVADILMPVMDGWRLVEEVRRVPQTSEIPFIFLTTEKEVKDRVKGLRLGADDYLSKPFSCDELIARAERILVRSKKMKEAVSSEMLSGHTKHLSIPDLLQILGLNGRTGTLRLGEPAGRVGRIHFREGRIIQATVDRVQGEKALFRLMTWPESRFVLEELPADVAETIQGTTSGVLMEGFTHWDELRRLEENLPPGNARFKIRQQVRGFINYIELSAAERGVIECVQNKMTVREIVDAVQLHDLEVYRAILGLGEKGFLEADGQEVDTQPLPRHDQR